ncbi:hypothetical protein JCM19231_2328 [Vibrio ishigakensis]|uniref:YqcC-like domain-containing protein n=1 Tax=Vibrio ishigakensis TaxID=1481914 RepID=A0A0B8NNZ8_9VIBR|nr:YqcC family protein [Vibrio ishigakensis]GAM55726.1 hypothetical protein JCM19231_2328 [Vibrio ishigakensis]
MNKQVIKLEKLFQQLTQRLQSVQKWDIEPPSQTALMSTQPFAVDTLSPEQWLKWIFVPKMQGLIEQKQPLPSGFSIAPYFEEAWRNSEEMEPILDVIRAIDEVFAC